MNIRFIAAVLLVVSAFVVCAGGSLLTKNIENDLLSAVSEIDSDKAYENVENSVREITELWTEKQKILTLFIDHEHCDRIGSLITQLEYYAKNGDADALLLACFQLSQLLEEMISEEKISIYNLL